MTTAQTGSTPDMQGPRTVMVMTAICMMVVGFNTTAVATILPEPEIRVRFDPVQSAMGDGDLHGRWRQPCHNCQSSGGYYWQNGRVLCRDDCLCPRLIVGSVFTRWHHAVVWPGRTRRWCCGVVRDIALHSDRRHTRGKTCQRDRHLGGRRRTCHWRRPDCRGGLCPLPQLARGLCARSGPTGNCFADRAACSPAEIRARHAIGRSKV